jgi:hypothetical protein
MKTNHVLCALAVVALSAPLAAVAWDVEFSQPNGTTKRVTVDAENELATDPGAATSTLEAEWCLTTQPQALPASKYLVGAKSFTAHNKSALTAYLRFDAGNVTTNGATGDEYAAGDKQSQDISGTTFGPQIRGAATGSMASGACLKLRWWK